MAVLSGGGRILIVDDDPAVARSLELIFISRSYIVRVAHSAEEAIETIAVWRPEVATMMLCGDTSR